MMEFLTTQAGALSFAIFMILLFGGITLYSKRKWKREIESGNDLDNYDDNDRGSGIF